MAQFEGKAYIVLKPQKFQLVAGADHQLPCVFERNVPDNEVLWLAINRVTCRSSSDRFERDKV